MTSPHRIRCHAADGPAAQALPGRLYGELTSAGAMVRLTPRAPPAPRPRRPRPAPRTRAGSARTPPRSPWRCAPSSTGTWRGPRRRCRSRAAAPGLPAAPAQPADQHGRVLRCDQQAGGAVDHGIGLAADRRPDDRGTARHGLDRADASGLVAAALHDDVRRPEQGRGLGRRELPGELHPPPDPQLGCELGEGTERAGARQVPAVGPARDHELGLGQLGGGVQDRGQAAGVLGVGERDQPHLLARA